MNNKIIIVCLVAHDLHVDETKVVVGSKLSASGAQCVSGSEWLKKYVIGPQRGPQAEKEFSDKFKAGRRRDATSMPMSQLQLDPKDFWKVQTQASICIEASSFTF
eukprot:4428757-Amphidinium_carterae.1